MHAQYSLPACAPYPNTACTQSDIVLKHCRNFSSSCKSTQALSMQVCTPPSDTESDSDNWGTWKGTKELHTAQGTAELDAADWASPPKEDSDFLGNHGETAELDAACNVTPPSKETSATCQWGDWKGATVEPMGEMADPADLVMYWSQC